MTIRRVVPDISSERVEASREFYTGVGKKRHAEMDTVDRSVPTRDYRGAPFGRRNS